MMIVMMVMMVMVAMIVTIMMARKRNNVASQCEMLMHSASRQKKANAATPTSITDQHEKQSQEANTKRRVKIDGQTCGIPICHYDSSL